MRSQDQAVLRRIGVDWTDLGTPKAGAYGIRREANAPSRTVLKRLVDTGLIECRTATYRLWGGESTRRAFFAEWGVQGYAQLSDEGRAAYTERFYDKVRVEARLTAQGGDVKVALQ